MAYRLNNERLAVEIAETGDYRGSRFEWAGFITEIKLLQGNHTFCVDESLTPGLGTGGRGLCSEFGIREAIGYGETRPGEPFPKLGIGLLTRPDEAEYQFFRPYVVEPFQMAVERKSPQSLCFTTLPSDCRGYAAWMQKKISLADNRLAIEYTVHNTGKKPFCTEEYCHNFFGIDHQPVGPDYVLKFPFIPSPWSDEKETMEGLTFGETEISWKRQPEKEFYFRLPGFDGGQYPWLWELMHRPSGAAVREMSRVNVAAAAVWGKGHVISPEMFVEVKLAPGERQTWTRIYEFFKI